MTRSREVVQEPDVPLLLRIVYFFLLGWWATGVWMLNRVPQVLTLRPVRSAVAARATRDGLQWQARDLPQQPFVVRALYFVLIGWWLSWLWANVAWAISATVIGLPLGIWMFDRLPAITTLMRT